MFSERTIQKTCIYDSVDFLSVDSELLLCYTTPLCPRPKEPITAVIAVGEQLMSSTHGEADGKSEHLYALPSFELAHVVDKVDEPETVTIYREGIECITTHWITIDRMHSIPLEETT